MTSIRSVSPDDSAIAAGLPRTLGPYSPAAAGAGLLYLSGQVAKRPGSTEVSGNVTEQTEGCLRNLLTVLDRNGLGLASLLKCNVYLVDMDDFEEMNASYEAVLGVHRPARTTVAVSALPLGARVEIEAVAEQRRPVARGAVV